MSSPGQASQASSGGPAPSAPAPNTTPGAPAKRSRVLLSCAPCRASKLKCDRAKPCSNCIKKDRIDGCAYAPKKPKVRPAKSMAARLKRLEGMVRGMFDAEAERDAAQAQTERDGGAGVEAADTGHVVHKDGQTNWIGATHFMAMLDDIEDLKSYFDDPQQEADVGSPEGASPDPMAAVMLEKGPPKSKQELLNLLPPRQTLDRLVMRYFNANSPSQHTVHRPTFVRQYAAFLADPLSADIEWLALLFMVMALGVYFSTWASPHELTNTNPIPSPSPQPSSNPSPSSSSIALFRHYRSAAGWALTTCKLTTYPGPRTLQPFLLYVEAEFLANRASQTHAWLLCALCIRIMVKMGLHRDPAGLPTITPYEGEMRRRMWNLATQLDLVTSFHMGLPSMAGGLESDTATPLNLVDEDLDPGCVKLPAPRPLEDYTHMSYPICKNIVCRGFGLVATQTHSLSRPSRSDVMRLDALLEAEWKRIPSFMKARPLADCVADPPMRVIQRFGIASLFQKSKAVLHRQYLIGQGNGREYAYSRRECLRAALALLEYHQMIWEAAQPGGMLSQNGWFVTGLAMHDFLLAAMIVYLVVQNYEHLGLDVDGEATVTPGQTTGSSTSMSGYLALVTGPSSPVDASRGDEPMANNGNEPPQSNANDAVQIPDRNGLIDVLREAHEIWVGVAKSDPGCQKAADVLQHMLRKIHRSPQESSAEDSMMDEEDEDRTPEPGPSQSTRPQAASLIASLARSHGLSGMENSAIAGAHPGFPGQNSGDMMATAATDVPLVTGFDQWIPTTGDFLDWSTVDDGLRVSSSALPSEEQLGGGHWAPPSATDFDFMGPNFWDQGTGPR